MPKSKTPVGVVSYKEPLTPESEITFSDGTKVTLAQWATLTNGACFDWLPASA